MRAFFFSGLFICEAERTKHRVEEQKKEKEERERSTISHTRTGPPRLVPSVHHYSSAESHLDRPKPLSDRVEQL